jgi:hypothetical protein
MIRPGGLLFVVSHLFAVSVSIVWVRLQEKVNKTWMWEIFFAGSHTEHHWGSCSLPPAAHSVSWSAGSASLAAPKAWSHDPAPHGSQSSQKWKIGVVDPWYSLDLIARLRWASTCSSRESWVLRRGRGWSDAVWVFLASFSTPDGKDLWHGLIVEQTASLAVPYSQLQLLQLRLVESDMHEFRE